MAIGFFFNGNGVTKAQYQQVLKQTSPDNQPPPGMLYHAAGSGADGIYVIEVWESQEAATRFFEDTLGAALQGAGINVEPISFDIINIMKA